MYNNLVFNNQFRPIEPLPFEIDSSDSDYEPESTSSESDEEYIPLSLRYRNTLRNELVEN